MGEVEVLWRERQRLGKTHPGLCDEENKIIPVGLFPQVKIGQQAVKLELIQILDLLPGRSLPLDDHLPGRIPLDQSLVHGIQDRPLQLMMKVHGRLTLMTPRIIIDQLLIRNPRHLAQLPARDQLLYPRLCHPVLGKRHVPDRSVLIDPDPLRVVACK